MTIGKVAPGTDFKAYVAADFATPVVFARPIRYLVPDGDGYMTAKMVKQQTAQLVRLRDGATHVGEYSEITTVTTITGLTVYY